MSSHLLNEVAEICDEVSMIDHGKLIVYDTLENVTARFSGNGGIELAEVGLSRPIDDDFLVRNVSSLSGVVSVEKADARNISIKFSGGNANQERLLTDARALLETFQKAGLSCVVTFALHIMQNASMSI